MYAATLAAKVFRALAAIIAAFDLDVWQGDAVNAFANSLIDEIVYIKCPDGFTIKGKCLLLRRALYKASTRRYTPPLASLRST